MLQLHICGNFTVGSIQASSDVRQVAVAEDRLPPECPGTDGAGVCADRPQACALSGVPATVEEPHSGRDIGAPEC